MTEDINLFRNFLSILQEETNIGLNKIGIMETFLPQSP